MTCCAWRTSFAKYIKIRTQVLKTVAVDDEKSGVLSSLSMSAVQRSSCFVQGGHSLHLVIPHTNRYNMIRITQSKRIPKKGGTNLAGFFFCSANCLAPNPNGRCSPLSFGAIFFFDMLASMLLALAFSQLCLSSIMPFSRMRSKGSRFTPGSGGWGCVRSMLQLRSQHSNLFYTLHTLHSRLATLHSTLHTLHSTLYTLHFRLYTLHCTLLTPHFTLHTLHSTLLTLHSTLYTPHSTLSTPHFTLHTLHFTLHIPHFTLYTLHSTFYTLHFTLYTPHFTLYSSHHTPHSPHYAPHSTLYTPHSTLYTLHSTLYTLNCTF